ncbi:MAG: hypothetical protein HYY40_03660 [Bacteroidetes bacterium]|nr:hypothetical protein [Bacteroidota bacterium]
MISLTTHKILFFTRKEFWFYDGEKINEGTYNVFSAAKKIYDRHSKYFTKYRTTQIDLFKAESELLKAIHPRLRYDIRLAEKKKMEFVAIADPTETECVEITNHFNLFIKSKPITPMAKRWLLSVRKSGKLFITKIKFNNENVVTHIFIINGNVVLNTQSFINPFFTIDDILKFANKLLHWKDIMYFKEMGFRYYNFGPVSDQLKGITQFKTNFGGGEEEYYRYIIANPFIFSLVTMLKKLIHIKNTIHTH